jgi:uncharacterized membrane protein
VICVPQGEPLPSALLRLIPILILAAVLRLIYLNQNALLLDELWSIEIAAGRGSVHQHVPVDQVVHPPPAFFSMSAAPWTSIWTHMEVTHPPLYSLILRAWMWLWGDTDFSGRFLSVAASLIGIALLFDVVRLQSGLTAATWGALIMAAACPQVEHARLLRSYTLLIAFALCCADLLVRINRSGMSRGRFWMLCIGVFSTAMTHYFAAGTLLGMLLYAIWRWPTQRRSIALAFAIAGCVFAVCWGRFMWQQRHLFATDDPSTTFLTAGIPHHAWVTALRILLAPLLMLFPVSGIAVPLAAIAGLAIYSGPFLKRVTGSQEFVSFWGCWLIGTVSVVAALDFTRQTDHLFFIRYILLAGPAVYAIIPMIALNFGRRACHVAGCVVLIGCTFNLPGIYLLDPADPRRMVRDLMSPPGKDDLLIIATDPADIQSAEVELIRIVRYLKPYDCKVAVLTRPATAEVLNAARKSRLVFIVTRGQSPQPYLKDTEVLESRAYPGLGRIWTLRME